MKKTCVLLDYELLIQNNFDQCGIIIKKWYL